MTLSRVVFCVDAFTTTKALDFFPRTLGCRLGVPACLMTTDKVAPTFRADPLAIGGVELDALEVNLGLGGFSVVSVNQGGENRKLRRRGVGVIRKGRIHDVRV